MLKIIIPVILFLLIIFFWKKIEEFFYNKFKIKLNYIVVALAIIVLAILGLLLYD